VRHFTVRRQSASSEGRRTQPAHPSIIGIGLGGDERRTGSEPFRAFYAQAARAGLRLTNHAGETTGSEAIWEALAIGSERIGHVVSAIQDENLVQELRAREVPLELCPTSNVRTGVCPSFAAHPLRRLFDLGLLVTLNSDDPAFFGSDLANEYLLATQSRNSPATNSANSPATPSVRASFPRRQKPHGSRASTLSSK